MRLPSQWRRHFSRPEDKRRGNSYAARRSGRYNERYQGGVHVKYRRVVITRHGNPDALQVVLAPLPEPAEGQVRIKVQAAGVAFVDLMMRAGRYPGAPPLPYSPGFDVVGRIDKLGAGVENRRLGDMVAALTRFGGYAEYVCVPADHLVPVPPNTEAVDAAPLVLNYVTAYQLLHRVARVQKGERILVHGGAGGVGTALLQLGKLAGLEMYATASKGKHELIKDLGATPIDYQNEDFVARIRELTGDGVDAVFDPIGGWHWRRSYRCLRRGGRLVPYGVSVAFHEGMGKIASSLALLLWLMLIPSGRKVCWIFGVMAPPYSSRKLAQEDLAMLFGLLFHGKIRPIIGMRLPLDDAMRAHILLQQSKVTGKIVLYCNH